MDAWRGFKKGSWCKRVDVRDFVVKNFTPYFGDGSFLQKPTERTKEVLSKVNELLVEENKKGGVLDVDVNNISSILAYKAGYIIEGKDIIKGLQTDYPLRRAVNPFAGKKMCEQACEAYGYKLSENVKNAFRYRTTHNDGVFHAYTEEMKKARHAGIITGLPDAYARGRIIEITQNCAFV